MASSSIDPAITFVKSHSQFLAKLLAGFGVTPNKITMFNFIVVTPVCVLGFASGSWAGYLIGLAACILHGYLDIVDGIVARLQNAQSEFGEKLDTGLDVIMQMAVVAAVVFGVYRQTDSLIWLGLGLTALFAQGASNFIGFELNHRFNFTSHGGSKTFEGSFKGSGRITVMIANMLAPSSFAATALLTLRYPLALGAIFNVMPWALLFIMSVTLIKSTVMFAMYLRSFEEAPTSEVAAVLKSMVIEQEKEQHV